MLLFFHHGCFNPCYLFSQSSVPCFLLKWGSFSFVLSFLYLVRLLMLLLVLKKMLFYFVGIFFWLEIFRFVGGCAVRMVSTESNKWGKKTQKKIHRKSRRKKKRTTDWWTIQRIHKTIWYHKLKNLCKTSHRMRSLHNKCNDESYTFHVYLITFGMHIVIIYYNVFRRPT